jgi:hypothetical protein
LQDITTRDVSPEVDTARFHKLRRCEFLLNHHKLLYNFESVMHWPSFPVFPMISQWLTVRLLFKDVFSSYWIVLISGPGNYIRSRNVQCFAQLSSSKYVYPALHWPPTNFRVATSDAVIKNAGPAHGLGSLAMTSEPLSIVSIYALLFSPSLHLSTCVPSFRLVTTLTVSMPEIYLQYRAPVLDMAKTAASKSCWRLNLRYRSERRDGSLYLPFD